MRWLETRVQRRSVLKGAGALVVSGSIPGFVSQAGAADQPLWRQLSPGQLDTYLKISEEGAVTAFFGKMDMGQGVDISIAQIVADELDVPLDRVEVVMGDTALTVNQGGASGSSGLEEGGIPLRNAAAEARRVLMDLAAEKLEVSVAQLATENGAVIVGRDPTRQLGYGELIGGRHFDVRLEWNGRYGNGLRAEGIANPKHPSEYQVVGQPALRRDLPGIVMGTHQYVVDVKVPDMVHGRVVRPSVAGSVPTAVNENSIRSILGASVVHEGDFLGVVAEREWDAIRAARQLEVTWSEVEPPFPEMDELYTYIRRAPVVRESAGGGRSPDVAPDKASVEAALAEADRVIEAEYEFPFQSHGCMAPACAVCDYRGDSATLWTGSQKPHYAAEGVAKLLDLPVENVRGIWVLGPGSYGRSDAGDAAMDAALMSRAVGRPVRVQGMRDEGTAWDPKAPASVHYVRAGFDSEGNVVGYEFRMKAFSVGDTESNESNPSHTLAGMLTGWPNASVHRLSNPGDRYEFPNKVRYWQTIAPLLGKASPLRTAHLRDPLGPQNHFASESFIDEMAIAVAADPVEFRLQYLKEARDADVLRAAAERYGWEPRVSGPTAIPAGGVVTGRGVAYTRRGDSVVAVIAEVEVNLDTGRVWPRKFVVAADQGLVVNPLWLERTLEGNIIHATSRALHEEVRFSPEHVTSVDWVSYPILEMDLAPEEIDVVIVNRPELPVYGAGEPSTRPVTPAIANAIFDATGLRIRRVPFTPERIRSALETVS